MVCICCKYKSCATLVFIYLRLYCSFVSWLQNFNTTLVFINLQRGRDGLHNNDISIQLLFLLIGGRGSTKSSFISHFNTTLVFINHPDLLLVSGFLFYFNTTLVFINPCGRSLSPLFPRISIQLLFLLIHDTLLCLVFIV